MQYWAWTGPELVWCWQHQSHSGPVEAQFGLLIEAEWRKYVSPTYAIIGSDNGLSPGRRQPIIWIKAGILLIEPIGRNFSEILIEIYTFSFKKMHLKISSGKWPPLCLGLNGLKVDLFVISSINKSFPSWIKWVLIHRHCSHLKAIHCHWFNCSLVGSAALTCNSAQHLSINSVGFSSHRNMEFDCFTTCINKVKHKILPRVWCH